MPEDTLAARMFFALNETERRLGRRRTLTEIGDGMAIRLGKPAGAYDPSVVRRQLRGVEPRTREERIALAEELGVDPGWLYFGSASKAPAPGGWVVTAPAVRRATEATPETFTAKPRGAGKVAKKKGA